MCEDFIYLPAVFPGAEVQRRADCESLETFWVQWPNSQASDLIQTARKTFDTPGASISFFDHDNEIFRIEHGYNKLGVSRDESIAAHALLTHDVFVVLDTKNVCLLAILEVQIHTNLSQDWRFARNPLVTDAPNIRFFAAAPMLSKSGHTVGVLAIFDTEPRASFLRPLRRKLEDYAVAAMDNMLGNNELLDRRSTPILQRDSVINGEYHAVTTMSPKPDKSDNHARFPMNSTRNYTPKFHGAQQSRGYIEQTPPSTASDDGHQNSRSGAYFCNYENPSVDSGVNVFPSLQDMITPDSGRFESPSPRPFSSSDITSLNIQPTNTPRNSLIGPIELQTSNVTIEAFLALSDEDCTERLDVDQAESDTTDMPSSPPLVNFPSSHARNLSSGEANNQKSLILRPQLQHMMAIPSPDALSERSHASSGTSVQAEVAYACHSLSKSLGYDMIYVAEVIPKQPGMSDKELVAPGGIEKRILAAHGVDRPLDLSSPVHLDVLRTRGGFDYALNSKEYDDDYDIGYLIPLHTELGPLRLRSSGLVVGAYKKRGRDDDSVSRKEEADKLRRGAEKLKHVFLKATRLQLQRSPSPNPYPANEAVEVGGSFTSTQQGQLQSGQAHGRSYSPQDPNVSGGSGFRSESRSTHHTPSEYSRPSTRQAYYNADYNRPESRSTRQDYSSSEYSRPDSRSAVVVSRQRQHQRHRY
jgi:hypothetical protein